MVAMVLSYQNCSRVEFGDARTKLSMGGGGNGDGYEGKPGIWEHYTPQVCSDIGANGQPLPAKEIFLFASGNAQLVRENCVDLSPPQNLDPGQVQIVSGGATQILAFNGDSYTSVAGGDFAVVASQCPAGMSMRASPVRSNIFGDSQYLVDASPNWWIQPGLTSSLVGSMASLPAWEINRATVDSESWRRASQVLPLTADRLYSYTFYARAGTTDEVGINIWQCGVTYPCLPHMNVYLRLNLTTGVVETLDPSGTSSLSTAVRPFAGGTIVTVFFTPTGSFETDIGVMPFSATYIAPQNDSIVVTGFQLEEVSNYCE